MFIINLFWRLLNEYLPVHIYKEYPISQKQVEVHVNIMKRDHFGIIINMLETTIRSEQ